jgi:hypothetical protein
MEGDHPIESSDIHVSEILEELCPAHALLDVKLYPIVIPTVLVTNLHTGKRQPKN